MDGIGKGEVIQIKLVLIYGSVDADFSAWALLKVENDGWLSVIISIVSEPTEPCQSA